VSKKNHGVRGVKRGLKVLVC